MAKLTCAYREGEEWEVRRRQLPIVGKDQTIMMDLNDKGLCIDCPQIRGRELEEFTRKFNLLSDEELRGALEINEATFTSILYQCVECVGCRRRVEGLFYQLTTSGFPTLDPLVLNESGTITLKEDRLKSPQVLGTLLYRHHDILNDLLDGKLRNKMRCSVHLMEQQRLKPFAWQEIWSYMRTRCREEMVIIDATVLHEVVENYLRKHKFCQGCRTKIEKAYKILVGEIPAKEKGFVPALYANFKRCTGEKHFHILVNRVDFIDSLMRRAEPEVNVKIAKQHSTERHAKTLEIAQEEILTCVGIILHERLRRIYVTMREDERACQVLAAVAVHALYRNFDSCVEKKQGISNLELLYQEIKRAEKVKDLKREQKKLKKKRKKDEKKNACRICKETEEVSTPPPLEDDGDVEAPPVCTDEAAVKRCVGANPKKNRSSKAKKQQPKSPNKPQIQETPRAATPLDESLEKCADCQEPNLNCPCETDVRDSGYGSEPNSHDNWTTSSAITTPEGSEVSCSDGFCNHAPNGAALELYEDDVDEEEGEEVEVDLAEDLCSSLCWQRHTKSPSLLQMLNEKTGVSDMDGDVCHIPPEVVLAYQCRRETVQQERQKLRERLRRNFDRLCQRSDVHQCDRHQF